MTDKDKRIAELEEALRPFAAEAVEWDTYPSVGDNARILIKCESDIKDSYAEFTVGDLRRAAYLLLDTPVEEESEGPKQENTCGCKSYNRPDWGGDTDPVAVQDLNGKEVCLDACIAETVQELWRSGIVTRSSCCGHGQGIPHIMLALSIDVPEAVQIIQRVSKYPVHVTVWAGPSGAGGAETEGPEPSEVERALEGLLDYRQADEEGVMVLTSRQAIHVVADALRAALSATSSRIDREKLAVIKYLAPPHFKWTGGPDQEEDPEWICDALEYGGARFENVGTPDVRLIVYDDADRKWTAKPGDWIYKSDGGFAVVDRATLLAMIGDSHED